MKIVRVLFAVSLALLAAAPAYAAIPVPPPPKPPAGGAADSERDVWRGQGIGICVGELRAAAGVTADELESTCGCALDRFMAGKRTAALPQLTPGLLRATMSAELLACASDQRPAAAAAIAGRVAAPATADGPPATAPDDAKPADAPAPAALEGPKDAAPDVQAWLGGLSLPRWITDSGLPLWAWVLLGLVIFMVLRGLLRGGDRSDLIGPPPNMRLGARANPPAPRRADPPPRG